MPTTFDHLLDYKLLQGSHEFPGPAGGACLNEVAIVAAGLDYRAVKFADDCPPCFSRAIAAFIIRLNDGLPDEDRQRLKPFVLRLAGSADTDTVEMMRARYALFETVASIACARKAPRRLAAARMLLRGHEHGLTRVLSGKEVLDPVGIAEGVGWELARRRLTTQAICILVGMLAIGKQAPCIDEAVAMERLTRTFSRKPERVPA